MPDPFEGRSVGLESPASHGVAVVPNDGVDLPTSARVLYVGTGGALQVVLVGGDTVTLQNLTPGFVPLRVRRVLATGTTAADILAFW